MFRHQENIQALIVVNLLSHKSQSDTTIQSLAKPCDAR